MKLKVIILIKIGFLNFWTRRPDQKYNLLEVEPF